MTSQLKNRRLLFKWITSIAVLLCVIIFTITTWNHGEAKAINTFNHKAAEKKVKAIADSDSKRILMDDFFGVNVGQCKANPSDVKKVAAWIRDYSQWAWLEPEKNQYKFTDALNTMNYDTYYHKLDKQGLKSLFVVQQTPRWISAGRNDSDFRTYPPSGDQDGLQPDQYKAAASFFYQLAARYGRRKIANKYLLTKDKLSGLNLMDAIEVYNEPDGNWGNHMTLKQYAALLNAVYDGNNNSLKGQYGIKAADPNMLVSIGGLAGNLPSLKKIVAFAGRMPFDIINAHFYTFRHVRENYRVSVAPEWSSLETDMRKMVTWAQEHAAGKPVWLTEIGWDTKDHNPEYVTEQEAANYLIRSYLLALGAGVKKCFWFIFSDLDDTQSGVFTSSGLFENRSIPYGGATQLKPKLTFWYNATFKNLVTGYYFKSNQSFPQGDSTIYNYSFTTANGKKRLSIMWYCPKFQYAFKPLMSRPSEVSYSYKIPGRNWKINKIVRPIAGTMEGAHQSYKIVDGNISLRLNATPIFIELEQTENSR